jgi:hypothetical protein
MQKASSILISKPITRSKSTRVDQANPSKFLKSQLQNDLRFLIKYINQADSANIVLANDILSLPINTIKQFKTT